MHKARGTWDFVKHEWVIYFFGLGTDARWSSILPDCSLMMSEKKSSSGTVAPRLFWLSWGGREAPSSSCGKELRWSSILAPWHRINMSKKLSSGIESCCFDPGGHRPGRCGRATRCSSILLLCIPTIKSIRSSWTSPGNKRLALKIDRE